MTIAILATEKKKRGFASLLNQFGESSAGDQLMSLAPVAETQTVNLTEKLNRMIAAGASFDVSTDDFQIVGTENLTGAEKHFLNANKLQILCTLQQAALKKYLSLFDLQMFIYEVKERAAVMSDGETFEPMFEIVSTVTAEWFADLLDEMSEPTINL